MLNLKGTKLLLAIVRMERLAPKMRAEREMQQQRPELRQPLLAQYEATQIIP